MGRRTEKAGLVMKPGGGSLGIKLFALLCIADIFPNGKAFGFFLCVFFF